MQTQQLTLPSFGTGTGEAQVVLRLTTHSPVFAGFGVTGGHQGFTVFSCDTTNKTALYHRVMSLEKTQTKWTQNHLSISLIRR